MNSLTSKSRCIIPILSALLILFLLSSSALALEMRTVVKDFVTTEWTLECPDGEILDLTTVDMTEQGIVEFIQCLGEIEAEVGVHISSHTVVEDFVVKSDEIVGTTEMSEAQVNKLKEIIDTHQIPSNAVPFNRPRIESIVLNGVVDSFIIVLPNGCVIDLTDVDIDPQVLQELIQLIEQFEAENGVHVTSSTTVKDGEVEKDRIMTVTHLTPQQIQQLMQFFQSKGIALLLNQKQVPIEMNFTIKVEDTTLRLQAAGDAWVQFPPPDPQTGDFPIEIIELNMTSVQPILVAGPTGESGQMWDVHVGLSDESTPPIPHGFFTPVPPGGYLYDTEIQLPPLSLDIKGPEDQRFLYDERDLNPLIGLGPWPSKRPLVLLPPELRSLELHTQAVAPDAKLLIDDVTLGLPLRVPVVTNGFGN